MASNHKVTVVSLAVATATAMMMMMMMMTTTAEAAAMLKAGGQSHHSAKTHRRSEVDTVRLQLDPKALTPIRPIRALNNESTSPWTYNVTFDDSLFPPVLSEARCSLRGCRDLEGHEDQNLESRPIMHQVLLLRRVRGAGPAGPGPAGPGAGPEASSYHYRLESRLLAVGCTCVRPNVLQQA